MDEHIGELAELYALGTLGGIERAHVDAHVRSCAECAGRIGEAEAFITQTVSEREPPAQLDRRVRAAFAVRQSSARRWAPLIAAAFVLGLLPGVLFGVLHRPVSSLQADHDRAIAALVSSHFLHAQFTPLQRHAPKAKVIYGRTAPWRLFVAQTTRAYSVAAYGPGGTKVLGTLHVSGSSAELFVADNRARSFALLDGTRVMARVRLP